MSKNNIDIDEHIKEMNRIGMVFGITILSLLGLFGFVIYAILELAY